MRRWVGVLLLTTAAATAGHAQAPSSEESRLRTFAQSVGAFLYFVAWPTATFDSIAFEGFARKPGGADLRLVLHGFSGMDGSHLWTELLLEIRNGTIQDLRWGRHNAVLFRPGETMGALGQVLGDLSRQYARSADPALAAAPIASARFASICLFNPMNLTLVVRVTWSGRTEVYTFAPNNARLFWSSSLDESFVVAFDNSLQEGVQLSEIALKGLVRGATPANCSDSEMYTIQMAGQRIGLSPVEWKPGFPHAFVDQVVAGTGKDTWACAAGFRWIDPDDPANLQCVPSTMGLVGIGLVRNDAAKFPFISVVRTSGPAARAGVVQGVWLVSVNGRSMEGMAPEQAIQAMRGGVGEPVTLGIAFPGRAPQEVTFRRE